MAKKRSAREGSVPPPKCKAILLCERVIIEAGTGQISLIGLFDELEIDAVPGYTGPFTVFLVLTDGIGGHNYEISIAVRDLDTDTDIATATRPELRWEDRLTKRSLFVQFGELNIEQAGSYDIVVCADSQELDRQRFEILAPGSFQDEGEPNND